MKFRCNCVDGDGRFWLWWCCGTMLLLKVAVQVWTILMWSYTRFVGCTVASPWTAIWKKRIPFLKAIWWWAMARQVKSFIDQLLHENLWTVSYFIWKSLIYWNLIMLLSKTKQRTKRRTLMKWFIKLLLQVAMGSTLQATKMQYSELPFAQPNQTFDA